MDLVTVEILKKTDNIGWKGKTIEMFEMFGFIHNENVVNQM
jgi:hypothetical protein